MGGGGGGGGGGRLVLARVKTNLHATICRLRSVGKRGGIYIQASTAHRCFIVNFFFIKRFGKQNDR